jgi:hypothetical protein
MRDQEWWEVEEDDLAKKVFQRVEAIEDEQLAVSDIHQLNLELYANKPVMGMGGRYVSRFTDSLRAYFSNTENVMRSLVDTACSLNARNQPVARFMPNGASWSKYREAKKLEKFVHGQYERLGIYTQTEWDYKLGGIQGMAGIAIFEEDGDVASDVVRIDEIVVPPDTPALGNPMELHRRRFVSKDRLCKLYPEHAEKIEDAPADYRNWTTNSETLAHGRIMVIESWRPGVRHSVCIANDVLLVEEYDFDYYPIEFYCWGEPVDGWYGMSLIEQVSSLQMQLNDLNRFIRRVQKLIAVPKVYGDFGSKVPKNFFDNEIGQLINTRGGRPPTFYTPQALQAELYNERDRLVRRMHELTGVSEQSSQSTLPARMDSGAAVREWNDYQGGRTAPQAIAYERFHMAVANLIVKVAKAIYGSKKGKAKKKDAKVTYTSWRNRKQFVRTVPWSAVDVEDDAYQVTVEASQDLYNTGLIDRTEARTLSGNPDIEASQEYANAGVADIDRVIELLEEGEWEAPEPNQDLQTGIKKVNAAYLMTKSFKDVPEAVPAGMLRWLDSARAIVEQAQAAMAPPPGEADLMAEQVAATRRQ